MSDVIIARGHPIERNECGDNDMDMPLIIKVASVPGARMQVYFIDNEEYFKRKFVYTDADGNQFEDNDERTLFFSKGAIDTVEKLGWKP